MYSGVYDNQMNHICSDKFHEKVWSKLGKNDNLNIILFPHWIKCNTVSNKHVRFGVNPLQKIIWAVTLENLSSDKVIPSYSD